MIALAALALSAAAAPPDFRRAWTCSSQGEIDGITTSVIRTLDKDGKQLDVDIQWNAVAQRPFTASASAMSGRIGPGDPPLRSGPVLLSWTGRMVDGADTTRPIAILHAKGVAPRRADGRPRIEHSPTTFTVEVPWDRVAKLARNADEAKLSVVNASGAVIHSTGVDLRQIGRAISAVEEALVETRWKMRDFDARCEPVTEYLTF